MVLNRADFGKFWKSLLGGRLHPCKWKLLGGLCADFGKFTLLNDSYTLANGFLTPGGTVCVDFR